MRISVDILSQRTAAWRHAGLVLVMGLLFLPGCGRQPQNDPVIAADTFFQLLRTGFTRQAYDSTSFAFQAQRSYQGFDAALRDLGLRDFTSFTWTRKVVEKNEAKLDCEIATKEKGKVLVAVVMTREDEGWKLYSLRTPQTDDLVLTENKFSLVGRTMGFTDAANKTVPPEAQLQPLVKEAMLKFNAALQMENFSEFYNYVSVAWQSQLLERQLKRAFQPFIEKGMNVGQIRDSEAVFDEPPVINTNGILMLKGHYPTEPLRVTFLLKFIYELPKWKLFGIEVSVLDAKDVLKMRGDPKPPEP